jgi:hypothetical protein
VTSGACGVRKASLARGSHGLGKKWQKVKYEYVRERGFSSHIMRLGEDAVVMGALRCFDRCNLPGMGEREDFLASSKWTAVLHTIY